MERTYLEKLYLDLWDRRNKSDDETVNFLVESLIVLTEILNTLTKINYEYLISLERGTRRLGDEIYEIHEHIDKIQKDLEKEP